MIDERPVGAPLSRELFVKGEQVDADLDNLIEQRDRRRRQEEGDRLEEMAFKEGERRKAAERAEEYHRTTLDMYKHLRSVYLALYYEKDRLIKQLEHTHPTTRTGG